MNRSSIGYIPPTPFRDDSSDVFVLPTVTTSTEGNDFVSPAEVETRQEEIQTADPLAERLESIARLRVDLRRRRELIQRLFQELSDLAAGTPAPLAVALVDDRLQPPTIPFTDSDDEEPATEVDLGTFATPTPDPPAAEQKPAASGLDRLAALKAQLARRIQSSHAAPASGASFATEGADRT